jgi:hypothetical protein
MEASERSEVKGISHMIFNRNKHDDERHETLSLPLNDVTSLSARIGMSVGELTVRGGAAAGELLHGELIMHPDFDVDVDLNVSNGRGDLRVKQTQPSHIMRRSNARNIWDIQLNDSLPTDLRVDQSTGEATLDLSALSLSRLVVERSVGESTINLAGDHRQLKEISVDSSTGETTLNLTGQFDALDVLRVDGSVGQIAVDLRGRWGRDLDARIKTSTGEVKLLLPKDVGVEVIAKTSIGSIRADGFVKDGKSYRNAACGTSPVTLRLSVTNSIGTIRLETER